MSKTALSVVPDDVIDAHEKLLARRKLALILKAKAVKEILIQVGDLVEVYQKTARQTWEMVRTQTGHFSRS